MVLFAIAYHSPCPHIFGLVRLCLNSVLQKYNQGFILAFLYYLYLFTDSYTFASLGQPTEKPLLVFSFSRTCHSFGIRLSSFRFSIYSASLRFSRSAYGKTASCFFLLSNLSLLRHSPPVISVLDLFGFPSLLLVSLRKNRYFLPVFPAFLLMCSPSYLIPLPL